MRLSSSSVDQQLQHDHQLAESARVFTRDPDVVQLSDLYREEGLVELEPEIDSAILQQQRTQRTQLAERVFARLGPSGTRAFTAHTVEQAMQALAGDPQADEARGLLGAFPELLRRYGYTDAHGRTLAPALSVRALYKARFNLIFERPITHDFSGIELQAYEGFHALETGSLPAAQRAEAASAFYRAGGTDAAEALAIWLFQGDQRADALALFSREYERAGALRLRNMALVARRPEDL